ncbi:MAG: hypothetical protein RSA00_04300, partial [Hydrogenoanaerobacterium sp.]
MVSQKDEKRKGLSPFLRTIISAYVLYIAYELILQLKAGKVAEGQRLFVLISIIVFVVSSIWMFWSVYKDVKAQKAEDAAEAVRMAEAEANVAEEKLRDVEDEDIGELAGEIAPKDIY